MKHLRSVLVLAALVFCFSSASSTPAQHPARVHYIDVGQAESILLEFDKTAVLIDAGGELTNDVQQSKHLLDYLNTFFGGRPDLHKTIDTIIISHPHIDHTMRLLDVMKAFTVKNLIDGGENKGSGIGPLNKARALIKKKGGHYFVVTRQDTVKPSFSNPALDAVQATEGDAHFKLIGGANGCDDANNDSIVVLMTYKQSRFIFTGDASDKPDKVCTNGELPDLVKLYAGTGGLNADVYKADHHGSKNGTDEAWIKAISPKISVISAGKHDPAHQVPDKFHAFQFGHPTELAVALMEKFTTDSRPKKVVSTGNGAKSFIENRPITKAVYCTCWDGDIVIDGGTLKVQTAH